MATTKDKEPVAARTKTDTQDKPEQQAPPGLREMPEGMRSQADDGSPLRLMHTDQFSDEKIARQDIGWTRPVADPPPAIDDDVTEWPGYKFSNDSARSNFDRVILWPGQTVKTPQDCYDPKTLDEVIVTEIGATVEQPLIPVNYVDRRKRALWLKVYDPAVPESQIYKQDEAAD
jgi:hypothetical protein